MINKNSREAKRPLIIFTALHLLYGGVELAITQQANYLVKHGYKVKIICTYNLGQPAYRLHPDVEIVYLTNRRPNRTAIKTAWHDHSWWRLTQELVQAVYTLYQKRQTMIRAIRQQRTGTIISTRHEHSILLSKYASSRVHKIAQLHHDHHNDSRLIKAWRKHYKNIDDFVLLLPILKAEVEDLLGDYNKHTRIWAIGNFLATDTVKPPARSWSERRPALLWIGRMAPEKGGLRLATLIKELANRTDLPANWQIEVFGSGEELPILQDRLAKLNLSGYLKVHGVSTRDEILKALGQAKALLMTSHSEGFGFVLLEAAMMQTPIIAYDVRVAPAALINSDNGYLIADDDVKSMARAVSTLLLDNGELGFRLQTGLLKLNEQYSEDKVMHAWQNILALGSNNLHRYMAKMYKGDMSSLLASLDDTDNLNSTKLSKQIITANPEIIQMALKNAEYARILLDDNNIIVPDGIGLVKAARILGYHCQSRLPGIELAERLLQHLQLKQGKLFLYGGQAEVMAKVEKWIVGNYPDIQVVGAYHGYGQDEQKLLSIVASTRPDLVLAGLGAPHQELFLSRCQPLLKHGFLIGVGGSFDIWSGVVKRAPKIWQQLNLEWLYRIIRQPRRLKRFIKGNVIFLYQVLRLRYKE